MQLTPKDKALLDKIANAKNPEQAIITAVNIITAFLKQPELFEGQNLSCPQEPD